MAFSTVTKVMWQYAWRRKIGLHPVRNSEKKREEDKIKLEKTSAWARD